MNINQLRCFVTVASTRSFTKAAEIHFLTQTAISLQIRQLEDTLGFQLFDRRSRPIELTPAGFVFFQEARAILSRIDSAVEKAKETASGTNGYIRVGYEKGYEWSHLSVHFRDFRRTYPNILFSCVREDASHLAELLLADELDIIFSWDCKNLRSSPEISYFVDQIAELSVAVGSFHPYASRNSLCREDLNNEPLIFRYPSRPSILFHNGQAANVYNSASNQQNAMFKSSDLESVLMMVAAEEGITVLPSYIAERLSSAFEGIVFLPLEGEDEFEETDMMWKHDLGNSALDCFIGFMKNRPLNRNK